MMEHAPLILDVVGTALTTDDRRRLAHPLTGGVILFARTWQNRAQLLELTSAIKAVRDDLLICVDHEGGRVQRFRTDGFTHLPPMRALGELGIAMVFQHFSLFDTLTVAENVWLGLDKSLSLAEVTQRISAKAAMAGIWVKPSVRKRCTRPPS